MWFWHCQTARNWIGTRLLLWLLFLSLSELLHTLFYSMTEAQHQLFSGSWWKQGTKITKNHALGVMKICTKTNDELAWSCQDKSSGPKCTKKNITFNPLDKMSMALQKRHPVSSFCGVGGRSSHRFSLAQKNPERENGEKRFFQFNGLSQHNWVQHSSVFQQLFSNMYNMFRNKSLNSLNFTWTMMN